MIKDIEKKRKTYFPTSLIILNNYIEKNKWYYTRNAYFSTYHNKFFANFSFVFFTYVWSYRLVCIVLKKKPCVYVRVQ